MLIEQPLQVCFFAQEYVAGFFFEILRGYLFKIVLRVDFIHVEQDKFFQNSYGILGLFVVIFINLGNDPLPFEKEQVFLAALLPAV